ncbi:MAG: YqeG family HAD IIIA-type phosphatase [Clostridiales bacterium]|jgi:HAD superfamily phosphatase (TIGR01668 family)|nr:YqeG family HAD IIIA-type phosphatase [Clostridiales bacterium]
MIEILYPDMYVTSVYSVPYRRLRRRGIDTLFFDVDNTLVPHDVKRPTKRVAALFRRLTEMGFKICVVSNGRRGRVERFVSLLPPIAGYVYFAVKPLFYGVKKACRITAASPRSIAIIGDQVFTDVLAGRRAGFFSVLVRPVSERDELTTALKRPVERIVIKKYRRSKRRRKNALIFDRYLRA